MDDDEFVRAFPESEERLEGMSESEKSAEIFTNLKGPIVNDLGVMSNLARVQWAAELYKSELVGHVIGVGAGELSQKLEIGWQLFQNFNSFTQFFGAPNVQIACRAGDGCVYSFPD